MIDILIISPYSDDNPDVVASRELAAEEYLVSLIKRGHVAFSIIVAFSDLTVKYNLDDAYGYWEWYCCAMIDGARVIHVLMLDGWEESVGVQEEIKYAKTLGKKIEYVDLSP